MPREPMPLRDDVVTRPTQSTRGGLMSVPWINWFNTLNTDVGNTPTLRKLVALTAQAATIAATPFPLGALAAGLYRVSYFVRVSTPATSSSSVSVQFGFTTGGVACTTAATAITGNTSSTVGTGVFLILVDSSTPVTYQTTYASSGATAMQYALQVVIEEVRT